jgi:hypothetical protein
MRSLRTAWLPAVCLGFTGPERFYLRRPVSGGLKLLTLGAAGIWWFIDCSESPRNTPPTVCIHAVGQDQFLASRPAADPSTVLVAALAGAMICISAAPSPGPLAAAGAGALKAMDIFRCSVIAAGPRRRVSGLHPFMGGEYPVAYGALEVAASDQCP